MNITKMTVKERIARLRRGEVLPGYKKTGVGVIPEGWESTRVRAIASSTRNSIVGGPFGSDLVSNDYVNQGVPVIRGQNMGEVWLSGNFVYVTSEKADSLKANLAHPEDIVLTQRGTLGQISIVPEKPYERYLISQSQMKLTLNRYIADPIQLPPLPEQHRIAESLSTWDEALEKLGLLIGKKRELKRGLMQVLLSGKRRFPEFDSGKYKKTVVGVVPEEWEVNTFAEIIHLSFKKVDPQNISAKCIELEHISQETGRILNYVPSKNQLSAKNVFKKGDVLFGKLRPYLKKYAMPDFDGVCSSEIWVLRDKSGKCINHYLFYLVQGDNFMKVANSASGTKMPRADWNFVKVASLPIPPLPEQRRIAECLSTLDREIELLEQEKAQRQTQKKALMELLLTGKVRVDVTDKEKNDGQE